MSGVAVGGLIAALTLASSKAERRKGRALLNGSFTFALLLIAFSLSHWFWLSWACLIGVGWGFLTQNASTNTLVQTLAPDAMRGRVMSAYAWVLMGLFPVGSLLAGVLASFWGADKAVLLGAVLLLAYTGWTYVNKPQIRAL